MLFVNTKWRSIYQEIKDSPALMKFTEAFIGTRLRAKAGPCTIQILYLNGNESTAVHRLIPNTYATSLVLVTNDHCPRHLFDRNFSRFIVLTINSLAVQQFFSFYIEYLMEILINVSKND